MPISTDLNISPYFDDYQTNNDFTKILFRPGFSVQTRELNQLQTLLQKQIERFGDNIFKRGTIVDGCNFNFNPSYPYIKIEDSNIDGGAASPALYRNYFLINETTNLKAQVTDYKEGFVASDPDLKTLYLRYLNSGSDSNVITFSSGDILKIYDYLNSVHSVIINNGGLRFSNSDSVIITSSVVANVATGSFSNGEYVTNGTANLQIVGIDDSIATVNKPNLVILSLKPRDSDLANASVNATAWTFSNNDSIINISNTVAADIESIIGSGMSAKIVTNGVGKVTDVVVTDRGSEYTTTPTIRIRSSNNSSGLTSLNLTARNYLTKITVSDTANSVGNGYAFGITEGVIYQKGYFLRVSNQSIIVDKYSTTPNAVSVGFSTVEEIITPEIDSSLLDNAFTEENDTAPGAHRLKMTPKLVLKTKEESISNTEFLPIVEWSEGNPFRQNQYTEYSKINDEMARRTFDESGNYAIDPFLISSRSPLEAEREGNTVSIVVDPGHAYISGYRVQTVRNYSVDIDKGIDTKITNTQIVSLNYGNYVRIKELGGIFQFSTGDTIDLYDTAKSFISNTTNIINADTTPVGNKIGTARIRSLISEKDNTYYKLYLFDVRMEAGKNFNSTRSVYYNGTNKGIADVVTVVDSYSNSTIAELKKQNLSTLLFYSGVDSLKNANNVQYNYRTIDQTTTTANTGLLTKDISSTTDEFFPYSGSLSDSQLSELIVTPIGADLIASSNLAGSISVGTTANTCNGTSTTYLSDLKAGDFVYLYSNSTASAIRKVVDISNNTYLTLSSNCSFANTAAKIYRAFPKHVPVPFGIRSGLSGNVNANGNILTLDFGMRFDSVTSVNTSIAVNITRTNAVQSTKTPNRKRFIKICCGNNAGGVNGPWTVGVPDVFRLRNVYVGNSSVNTSSNNAVSAFYIDHNQTSDYYDLSWLYLKPKSNLQLSSANYLLVEFDYFTTSGAGFYDTVSYVSANAAQRFLTDSTPLADLSSTINSFEIPEIFTYNGINVDPLAYFDFRPYAANTVAPTTNSATAPLNPSNTLSFGNTYSSTNDKKFPVPDSNFTSTIEQFVGRIDSVFVNKDGKIFVTKGVPHPDAKQRFPSAIPNDAFKIADLNITPYPNVPILRSPILNEIIYTRVSNEKFLKLRLDRNTITKVYSNTNVIFEQTKGYSMADIAKIDKRLTDVEYYVNLNLLESDLKDRFIASSIDPTLDRFKYGFFVDDAHNYLNSDKDNPHYSAYVEDDCFVPEKLTWLIQFEPVVGTIEYVDHVIIEQNNATNPKNWTAPCLPSTKTANAYSFRISNNDREVGNTANAYTDTYNITLASAASAGATLYFYNYDNDVKIEIYQGNTVVKTSNNATNLTLADKRFVTSNTASNWFDDNANTYLINFTKDINGYAKYSGKITWTHNPARGRQYTIKVHKGSGAYRWKYLLEYPIDRETVGCPLEPEPPTIIDPPYGVISGIGGAEGGASGCGSGGGAGGD